MPRKYDGNLYMYVDTELLGHLPPILHHFRGTLNNKQLGLQVLYMPEGSITIIDQT